MGNQTNIRHLIDRVVESSIQRGFVYGILGSKDTDTPAECVVASDPKFVYVRVSAAGTQSVGKARNPGNVALRANTPVKMKREGGSLVIIGYDTIGGSYEAATAGDAPNLYGIPYHTHRTDSGLSYEIESARLEPGRVHADSHDMIATVNGFRHHAGTFAGGTIDLSSFIPAAGYHGWVLVGVDPATNTAIAEAMTPVTLATPLVLSDIDTIVFDGFIPLGAFEVTDTMTELAPYATEAREWFNPAGGSFNDSEGDPVGVGEVPVDGVSNFAARRDHQHANDSLIDTVNGQLFEDYRAAQGIPDDWVEHTAAVDSIVDAGYWRLFAPPGQVEINYHKQTPFDMESTAKYISFGPILVGDVLATEDYTWYVGVNSNDGGFWVSIDWAHIALNWDSASQTWRTRWVANNGGVQSYGSWFTLPGPPLHQPLYFTIFAASRQFTFYMGYTKMVAGQMPLGVVDLSAMPAWGQYHVQVDMLGDPFRMAHTWLYIGGVDYIAYN